MTVANELISHAAILIPVSDMQESLVFYMDKLGFKIIFEWNNPVDYALLKRGDVSILLTLAPSDSFQVRQQPLLYIFVYDIQKLYEELLQKNVHITTPISTREYQMTNFDTLDPDGHMLTFGQGS